MEMTKRLFRSNDRMLGGVCAGIADYIGWDPTLVRIAYIVLSIVSAAFPGLLVYLILWIVIPPKY
ncbi:MAG: PspC domain-containing protein [Ekhidna sp.]